MNDRQTEMQLQDYTERSFGVYGNTKPYKDSLKKMGGKFNPRLQNGPGWVFANHLRGNVEKYIETGEVIEFQWRERGDNDRGRDDRGRDDRGGYQRRNNFQSVDQQLREVNNRMYLLLERIEYLENKVLGQDGYPPLGNPEDSVTKPKELPTPEEVFDTENEGSETEKPWTKPNQRLLKKA